jgi:hypothetical protein
LWCNLQLSCLINQHLQARKQNPHELWSKSNIPCSITCHSRLNS